MNTNLIISLVRHLFSTKTRILCIIKMTPTEGWSWLNGVDFTLIFEQWSKILNDI